MTATAYRPLTIERIVREEWGQDYLDEGQGLGMAATGLTATQLSGIDGRHPGVFAWERLVDETIEELAPQIRDLVCDAIERRLPWTWEPER